MTVIAFVGSVFSPYYVWDGRAEPENHVAINVALYGPGVGRWAMTERGRSALSRDAARFQVGPSALSFDGGDLVVDVRETCAPWPRPLRGRVRLSPEIMATDAFDLDGAGRHIWAPIAPSAHVEIAFDDPAIHWRGRGYCDANWGAEPVARGFSSWDWSRADLAAGPTVLYDAALRDGGRRRLALAFDRSGQVSSFEPPPRHRLAGTIWGVERHIQADADARPEVLKTLENAPFYARSLVATRLLGEPAQAMHETLDCDRLDRRTTRLMLPFRMPRRAF